MMIDALEKRLIEALKSVDAHGDIAPAHVGIVRVNSILRFASSGAG
jgi:hypothetical protein